ncbi:MAG: glycosyltransferase family A protein [Candidatus Binatus sp.]|uniref:glycosyltransferase family 2 protein n=1 Tax=Candidatus Binatus sp. TaxID=2811406 RepID=UPI0027269C66|nr:glycosyltransferase family A protein [Candidatus Binatus sp.]MDO8431593.1 glycosyltransferase family A protein [Candidatus Binatus sp.]
MRISVIIPVFNGERTIRAAIESALAQDFEGSEVIVVDDGSTDSTARLLAGYGARIKVVTQSNRGVCAARNTCVAAASGKYLAFLDADDEFMPGKLAKSYRALEQNPGAALAFSDLVSLDAHGNEIDVPVIGRAPTMDEMLSRGWPILPTGAVMPRAVFDRCGGFCEDFKQPGGDDPYMWLLAREQGEFIYIAERLAIHRSGSALQLAEKYRAGIPIFKRLVRARYGSRADGLIRDTHHFMSAMYIGGAMNLLDEGEIRDALAAWLKAARYRPAMLFDASMLARLFVARNLRRLAKGIGLAVTRRA